MGGTSDGDSYDPELAEHGGAYTSKIAVLQVTVRLPFDWSFLNILGLFFSFIPFGVPVVVIAVILVLLRDWFVGLNCLAIMTICCLMSECILKPLCAQPRPRASANRNPD